MTQITQIKNIYIDHKDSKDNKNKILTQEYNYHDFHTPMLEDPDFEAKPLVMVMGQYSTGKTTFIRLNLLFVFRVL